MSDEGERVVETASETYSGTYSTKGQLNLLADFIVANSGEHFGGGVGDAAVYLLERFATNVQAALKELGVPNEDYPAPIANAVDFLNTALGKWERE